ncbi:ATP-binding protein, partial [candidate division WOR-3 bacterium]|nr:ATP-binding protein [candidate division WOR-3 bacterium]
IKIHKSSLMIIIKKNKSTTIKLRNNVSEIDKLRLILSEFGKINNLSQNILFKMNLALEETVTNIIKYAYNDDTEHVILIHISLSGGTLTAEIEDNGKPFNPLNSPKPDINKPIEYRTIGGLGIHIVRNLMDKIEYRRDRNKNFLILRKGVKN